jgi:phage terminase large subunit GpA-like protein
MSVLGTGNTAEVINRSMGLIVPSPLPPMDEFLREHFRDRSGRALIEGSVPWVTAPGGPCDAIDNPQYSELWLQWAARTFKTTFGMSVQMRQAAFAPCSMMYATRNENLLKQVFARFYQLLEKSPLLSDQLPPVAKRSSTRIRLAHCQILGTWAGSKSGLADESIKIGHGGEVDKWDLFETSTEGDPLPRFLKRGGEYPDRKFLIESTPGKKGVSRIERGRLLGTNHEYWVPCPHCAMFQPIVFGDGKEPPGIFWDRLPDDTHDLELARQTARYVCPHCGEFVEDEDRFEMSNLGVWVPAGCTVDHDKAMRAREFPRYDYSWLRGEPDQDGRIYSSQMSVFHALFHGFGDIASDFLRKRSTEVDRRQWTTEEAGETWDVMRKHRKWQDLYERLITDIPPQLVPEWASLLTAAVDRQKDHYVWAVLAWGPSRRHHLTAYGDGPDLQWVRDNVLSVSYEHADAGDPLRVGLTLIDNGYRPDSEVEEFCVDCLTNRSLNVWTCEGSERRLQTDYEIGEKGKHTTRPGFVYVRIDTSRTQQWIENVLHTLKQGDAGSGSIHGAQMEEHQDLLEQLLNENSVTSHTTTGHDRERWERVNRDIPNDFRDVWRYAFVAMQEYTRNVPLRARGEPAPAHRTVATSSPTYRNQW